ncbi:MAG: hypothetical protein OEZ32_09400 [Nitrospinota bacterium]|nr:hypothetical protein [Nitrospinota bacterium]
MKAYRQGDVILFCGSVIPVGALRLDHLTLAKGEATGHSHRITEGSAQLYEHEGVLYLQVLSDIATLSHEQHERIGLPMDNYMIRIQREYQPEGWTEVVD